ncbi:alpha-hydroxy-acid oxidizing protein [Virgibacillus sp. NKC19-16]|uniref:alpha-hydroxy-acid oxidizing protein n=1 Tax=Virgibacillus salidurans TaxID=2831673 RepID=UPI001F179F19|nr:alpha-hydroxy-acid oxidizing protein [Virgibacillus sp. NKC19-16]UJL47412.1 alpha-hydroxy-acid oxidizing protein [Virgibacillus sp. NKC19-16]
MLNEIKDKINYSAPKDVKELDVINVFELEKLAKAVLPKDGYDFIYGGAGDEYTLRNNIEAWNKKGILQRVLADTENPDMRTTILDQELQLPVIVAPIAAHGIAHDSKEAGTAKGVSEYGGSIMSISAYSSSNFDDIENGLQGNNRWFQIYMSDDIEVNKNIIDEAKAVGASAIILTADTNVDGRRERNLRNKFVYPFGMPIVARYLEDGADDTSSDTVYSNKKLKLSVEDVKFLTNYSDLPIFVKGVQTPDDALKAIGAGASGIWVSNHGGRQLDGAPSSFDTLEDISNAIQGEVPIVFDSGIRRGEHIFKAIASGADLVAIGRPVLYGLANGGWKGVKSVFEYFEKDLRTVMQLAGTQTIEDIKNAQLFDYNK